MSKPARIAATVLGCAVAAGFFARLFAKADAAATWQAITSAGPLVALAPVPFAMVMTLDAYGTVVLLRALGHPMTLARMLPVRVATEALHLSMPAGFVASDTATAMLLEGRADAPMRDGVVASIARRWLVMRAHAIYIVLGAAVGFPALTVLSGRLLSGPIAHGLPALPWLVLTSAAVPIVVSSTLGAGLLGRSTFARLLGLLARVPSARLASWVHTRRSEAVATDGQVVRLRAARRATMTATLSFVGCWCVEALESALLLRLVGADVDFAAVVAVEAGITLLRSVAVVAPSGLGVVDLGYATVFPALGADAGCAAAFVLLKRGKELAWVMAGYAILAALRGRAAGLGSTAAPALSLRRAD